MYHFFDGLWLFFGSKVAMASNSVIGTKREIYSSDIGIHSYKTYCIKSCKSLHLKSSISLGDLTPKYFIITPLIHLSLITLT